MLEVDLQAQRETLRARRLDVKIYSAQPESELFSARAAGRCRARPRMSARVLVSGGVVYRLG